MEASKGYTNGYAKGPKMNGINGHAGSVGPTKKKARAASGPTLLGRLFSITARLFTWYTIISILFRCPASIELCDETSPRICKPYFQAKHAITPHIEPHYRTHVAPYVDVAKPYYDLANERVFVPTGAYVAKYGAPAIAQAQTYGQAQWEKTMQPRLAVYQKVVQEQYDEKLAPHVNQASALIGPYYEISRNSALQTYHEYLLPSYEIAHPYLAQAYGATSQFTSETAVPAAYWAWNRSVVFLDTTVWPQVRVLYVENVEPQLARIGQRLGRYKEKSKAAVENGTETVGTKASSASSAAESVVSASSVAASSSSSTSSAASAASSNSKPVDSAHIPDPAEVAQHDETEQVLEAPSLEANGAEVRKTAQEEVAADLELWHGKFSQAAEESAAEIEDRIAEIAEEKVQNSARKTGHGLVQKLQATIDNEISVLKQTINTIVEEHGENASDDLLASVRRAGMSVKEKAQAVRDWKSKFEQEMEVSITKAAEEHFRILNGIRDHALQRIGMKWAWMDGVTYKDWAKFHELRDTFDVWTRDLKQLIVTHPALDYARAESGEVEDAGMTAAQHAAQELARLKEVALWKLAAADSSDNFDSDDMREAAEAAEKAKIQAAEKARAEAAARVEEDARAAAEAAAVKGSSEPEADPLEEEASVIEEESPATDLPDEGVSEPEEDPLESAASVMEEESPAIDLETEKAPIASEASSVVDEYASNAAESIESVVSEGATILAGTDGQAEEPAESPDLASTIIDGDDHTFIVGEDGSTPADDDSQKPLSPEQKAEQVLEDQLEEEVVAESAEDTPVEAATGTVKPAFLGAMAQEVPNRGGPILDDDEDTLESFSERAQKAYNDAVAQASARYSIASSAVSAKIHGTPEPEPVQEQMFAAISSRYAAATELANLRFNQALDAASQGVYGTATTTAAPSYDWAHVESLAGQRLQEGRIWAEEQFEAAKIALGYATATPTASTDRLYEQAKANYYAGLGAAQVRYSEFLDAASSALSSLTASQTPTDVAGTASSVASVATESANAVASGASNEGLSLASAVGDGVNAAASIVGEAIDSAAQEVLDAAEAVERGVTETWENVVAQISVQIYGAPTPTSAWYDKAYDDVEKYAAQASSQAAKQYDVVYSIVQELIVGKEPTASESILSRLQAAYATGAASAAQYLNQATAGAGGSANAAKEKVESAAAAAADAVRENVGKDEL